MSPKQQFQSEYKEDVKWLADQVVSSRFQRCLNYAMLEYTHSLTVGTRNASSYDSGFDKILGAQQFKQALESLADMKERTAPRVLGNLDHKS